MVGEGALLLRQKAQPHARVSLLEDEAKAPVQLRPRVQDGIRKEHCHNIVGGCQPPQRQPDEEVDGIVGPKDLCQTPLGVNIAADRLRPFIALGVDHYPLIRRIGKQKLLRGHDANQYALEQPLAVHLLHRTLRCFCAWLATHEVRGLEAESFRAYIDSQRSELIHHRANVPVVARVPLDVALRSLNAGLRPLRIVDAGARNVRIPVTAEHGVRCVEAQQQTPVTELDRDLGPPRHEGQGGVPHSVTDVLVPRRVREDIVAREADCSRELRSEVHDRCEPVQGS
mmetsp:Transcript_102975/g.266266  ORF Transcript_102975/g.266266 Transcript_102975/m.266266 type:complete len:284 (-) Transcript_102975:3114-3965(-)